MASVIGEVRGSVLLRTRSGPIFEMTVGVAPLNAADRQKEPVMVDGLLRPPPIF